MAAKMTTTLSQDPGPSATPGFTDLPNEIVLQIFVLLPFDAILNLSATSPKMRDLYRRNLEWIYKNTASKYMKLVLSNLATPLISLIPRAQYGETLVDGAFKKHCLNMRGTKELVPGAREIFGSLFYQLISFTQANGYQKDENGISWKFFSPVFDHSVVTEWKENSDVMKVDEGGFDLITLARFYAVIRQFNVDEGHRRMGVFLARRCRGTALWLWITLAYTQAVNRYRERHNLDPLPIDQRFPNRLLYASSNRSPFSSLWRKEVDLRHREERA